MPALKPPSIFILELSKEFVWFRGLLSVIAHKNQHAAHQTATGDKRTTDN